MDMTEKLQRHDTIVCELKDAAADRGVFVQVADLGRYRVSGPTTEVLETVAVASGHLNIGLSIAADGYVVDRVLCPAD